MDFNIFFPALRSFFHVVISLSHSFVVVFLFTLDVYTFLCLEKLKMKIARKQQQQKKRESEKLCLDVLKLGVMCNNKSI